MLIVDDNATNRRVLDLQLGKWGLVPSATEWPAEAIARVERGEAFDLAILDVNIAGRAVFPIAEKLSAKGVPLVFTTGYGREGLPAEWQGMTVLAKPYTFKDVAGALLHARGAA